MVCRLWLSHVQYLSIVLHTVCLYAVKCIETCGLSDPVHDETEA